MRFFDEAFRRFKMRAALSELPLCEQIARVKYAIQSGRAAFREVVLPEHRTHLAECCQCCDRHQAVVDAFRAYDREQLSELGQLIGQFRSAIHYRDRLHLLTESGVETRALLEGATVDGDSRAGDGSLGKASPEQDARVRELLDLDPLPIVPREEKLFAFRAIMLACLVGYKMRLYAASHSPNRDPWMEWRHVSAGHAACEFTQNLNVDSFVVALAACKTSEILDVYGSQLEPLLLPSCGDLAAVPGAVTLKETCRIDEWEQTLMLEELRGSAWQVDAPALLRLVLSEAARDAGLVAASPAGGSELLRAIQQLQDAVESNNALQIPIMTLLEGIARQLGQASRWKAEESLISMLGRSLYGGLCAETRVCLVAAEQIYRSSDFARRGLSVLSLAHGFELQLKRLVEEFRASLHARGVREFPPRAALPANQTPVLPESPKAPSLFDLQRAFEPMLPEYVEFCGSRRIDARALVKAIKSVRSGRNPEAHALGLTELQIESTRAQWLDGQSGVFAALMPHAGEAAARG
jgi:hypothetical protein